MTRNNLQQQLHWLLSQKPFVPSWSTPYSNCKTSFEWPTSSAVAVVASQHYSQDEGGTKKVSEVQKDHVSYNPAESKAILVSTNGCESSYGDMARLRAAPTSSSKPRLISLRQESQQKDSSHLARTPRPEYENGGRQNSTELELEIKKNEHTLTPRNHVNFPTNNFAYDSQDVDTIDLTGDLTRRNKREPGTLSGRKRKSEEVDSDFGATTPFSKRNDSKVQQSSQKLSNPEYTCIDSLFLEDAHTLDGASRRRSEKISPTTPGLPLHSFKPSPSASKYDHRVAEEGTTQAPVFEEYNQGTSRKSPERSVTTGADIYPNLPNTAILPKHTSSDIIENGNLRVADSEDEDEQFLCESQLSPKKTMKDVSVNSQSFRTSPSRKPETAAKQPNPTAKAVSEQHNSQFDSERTTSEIPPRSTHKDSSSRGASQSQRKAGDTIDELSENQKVSVRAFLEWTDARLEQTLEESQQELKLRANAYFQLQRTGNDSDTEDKSHALQKSKDKKSAVENLIFLRKEHQAQQYRHGDLQSQILDQLKTQDHIGLGDKSVTEWRKLGCSMTSLKSQICQQMTEAELLDRTGMLLEPHRLRESTPEKVVVESTQTSQASAHGRSVSLTDNGAIRGTQFVQQTQIPSMQPPKLNPIREDARDNGLSNQYEDGITTYKLDLANVDNSLVDEAPLDFQPTSVRSNGNTNANISTTKALKAFKNTSLYEENNSIWQHNMSNAPFELDNDDDYDGQSDFAEIIEAAEDVENQIHKNPPPPARETTRILSETSGNQMRHAQPSQSDQNILGSQLKSSHAGMNHPWSGEVKTVLKRQFRLKGFRMHQLEAINSTLAGKDVFVLMPTGGGKSLCYQLPAVVTGGKTRGVTLVVSPLLSLMEDQVNHLRRNGIQAFYINGECSAEHRQFIRNALQEPQVEQFIQLLYVTPEMISKNQSMVNAFKKLHDRNRLARIVIDEAHCVSQWGHDFRPDYKAIGDVRRQFNGVPVMALTATATENVKLDVMHNLGITRGEVFAQSFNRPNLEYEVLPKKKDVLESIANIIGKSYKGQCGIVYCLSRKKCEDVAAALRSKYNVKAYHYHAGMESEEKKRVQKDWQSGKHHVIVATIAFGMGIDKPDVRFVIHHSIPKSLEGYYQETGRAGRDYLRSGCYLFYSYQDVSTLRRMIDQGEGSYAQIQRQREMLRSVVQYCENKSDCRRVQVLAYFNERFGREDCNQTCDNCNSTSVFESQDFTDHAIAALKLVKKIYEGNVTSIYCADLFRGGKAKAGSGHDRAEGYGEGSDLAREDIERLFNKLIDMGALFEKSVVNGAGFATQYLRPGNKVDDILRGKHSLKLEMQVRVSPRKNGAKKPTVAKRKKAAKSGTGVPAAQKNHPLSTNVSSPIQAAAQRRQHKPDRQGDGELLPNGYARDSFVVGDEEDDDEDDGFEPVRVAGRRQQRKEKDPGPPITSDATMSELDDVHRLFVDNFVVEAGALCRKILLDKSLRAVPFTDTVLREMAISFPTSATELKSIPGINPEMVRLYGRRFLSLIKKYRDQYEEMQDEQRPFDRNHVVVDLVTDDEEEGADEYGENVFSDGEEESEEEEGEASSYFALPPQQQDSSRLADFNARLSQFESQVNSDPDDGFEPDTSHNQDRGQKGKGSSSYARKGFKKRFRKTSNGSKFAGVRKRNSAGGEGRAAGGARASAKKPPQNRRSGGGFEGGGRGIGMMPV